MTRDEAVTRFFGDLKRWPKERNQGTWSQPDILLICERIAESGDCLWHAQALVMGWEVCHCARCNGGPTDGLVNYALTRLEIK